MMTLPHHRQILMDSNLLKNEVKLNAMKGDMIGILGETWNLSEDLTTIEYPAPRPPVGSKGLDIVGKCTNFQVNSILNHT